MSRVIDSYGGSGGSRDVGTIDDRNRALSIDGPWHQALLLRLMLAGSAGVVVLVSGYAPYLPHVGTSPTVFDSRGMLRSSSMAVPEVAAEGTRMTTRHAVLRMSSTDQALEVMAALNLNKTQFAEVLRVSRPTLYDWLEGKAPNVGNARRLTSLLEFLADTGVTSACSLSPRFVRESLKDGEPSLLDLLKADTIDKARVAEVLAEAKVLEGQAEKTRLAREERLLALGFEKPMAERRKANLALNIALREWPKD